MTEQDEQGTVVALLERFRLQRLPRAIEIRDKVKGGEKLADHDIAFLEQVFADVRDVQPVLARHPELAKLAGQVSGLYKEIMDLALANEQGG